MDPMLAGAQTDYACTAANWGLRYKKGRDRRGQKGGKEERGPRPKEHGEDRTINQASQRSR